MGNLFISELFAKALVLILSILVAREFGDSVSLDIFTWTLFFYVSIHSWLFGTLEYTIVPTFSELDDHGRGLALTSLLAFATGIMAVITPVLAMNYESIFSALTSFDSAAVGEFYRFFLILFIYFFANTVYSIFELSINQKNIYVLPVVLRGIINPLIIIAKILKKIC